MEAKPRFSKPLEIFTLFTEGFLAAVRKGLESFHQTHLAMFESFKDKYQAVGAACETWNLTPHEAHFKSDSSATGDSLEQLLAAQQNCAPLMTALASFCLHSGSTKLRDVIGEAKGTYKAALTLTKEAMRIAGLIFVAGLLVKDGATPEDAKATMDVANKSYGLTRDKLPQKMQKLVGDLLKTEGTGKEGEAPKRKKPPAKDGDAAKEPKKKREKVEKKDKKEK